jgi:hypothetical protein
MTGFFENLLVVADFEDTVPKVISSLIESCYTFQILKLQHAEKAHAPSAVLLFFVASSATSPTSGGCLCSVAKLPVTYNGQ